MTQVQRVVIVDVDDERLAKENEKRTKVGRQPKTAEDEVEEALSENLRHNLIFEKFKIVEHIEQ